MFSTVHLPWRPRLPRPRTQRSLVTLVLAAGLGASTLASPAPHDGLHERIARVSESIAGDPSNAGNYLTRARLRHEHGDPAAAHDLTRAAALGLGPEVALTRGELARERGWLLVAEINAREALEAPHLASRALLLLLDIATARGDSAAARDLSVALEARGIRPDPGRVLARARLFAAQKQTGEALAALDEALRVLGTVPALELFAVELEVGAGAFESALARIDRLAAHAEHEAHWLVRRADILEAAGRKTAAREALEAALQSIAASSSKRRNGAAMRTLAADAAARLRSAR